MPDVKLVLSDKMIELYRCEQCGSFIGEDEGVTTKSGRWVCDHSSCRDLDKDGEAVDKRW